MFADILIVLSTILIGLRIPSFKIFDRLLANDRTVTKNQILYLFFYVIAANLIGVIMVFYGISCLMTYLSIGLTHQSLMLSSPSFIKSVIFAILLGLQSIFVIVPLIIKMKQILPKK